MTVPDEFGLKKDLSPEDFARFRDWIDAHSGIFLEQTKADSLRISLVTLATRRGITDYGDYFKVLEGDEAEFRELMNLVTINETSFFRFPAQFDALRDRVIPEIVDGRSSSATKRFRVWSAGCSTGEEPYTIGMTLLDSALDGLGHEMQVVGTDVSTRALDRARKGVYPDRALANLPPPVAQRWFEPVRDGHRPVKRVRDICEFHYQNLIREPFGLAFMSNWDVIFCRNVTIYFKVESTRRVVNQYFEALNPGGYLFIGHSETLTSISERFEPIEIGGLFLYRKPPVRRAFTFDDIVTRREKRAGTAAGKGAQQAPPLSSARRIARGAPAVGATPAVEGTPPGSALPPTDGESGDTGALLDGAHVLLESANAPEALAIAQRVLAREPHNIDAHIVAAFAFADLGQLDAATQQAQEALRSNPLTAAGRYILGIIALQRGDTVAALREFKRTVYIDEWFVLAHFAIGNIHKQAGNLSDAARAYENTLRAMNARPEGTWTAFLGGFTADLLARTCERSLLECKRTNRP